MRYFRLKPTGISTQLGKLEILRRPPASAPAAPCLRQPQDDSTQPGGLKRAGSKCHPEPPEALKREARKRRRTGKDLKMRYPS